MTTTVTREDTTVLRAIDPRARGYELKPVPPHGVSTVPAAVSR